jgi:hypothetical protein
MRARASALSNVKVADFASLAGCCLPASDDFAGAEKVGRPEARGRGSGHNRSVFAVAHATSMAGMHSVTAVLHSRLCMGNLLMKIVHPKINELPTFKSAGNEYEMKEKNLRLERYLNAKGTA